MTAVDTPTALDCISIDRNIHGREFISINHPAVQARIALEGAHIVSCKPADQGELLWMSPSDPEVPGSPLRGGIPICWPWFSNERAGPAHGIARTSHWVIKSSSATLHQVSLVLELPTAEISRQLPGEHWQLEAEFILGQSLSVTLTTRNIGTEPQVLSQALHTYLPVTAIQDTQLWGLEGCHYIDQVSGVPDNVQQGAVIFSEEVDRIYYGHQTAIQVQDGSDQLLGVTRSGSASVVVWNPWIAKSQRLSHFPPEGYLTMVCVEAANAGPDARIVEPGDTHVLATEIKRT